MHIKFGFGKQGLNTDDLKYNVDNYDISLDSDPRFAKGFGDFVPGVISVNLTIDPREEPELLPAYDDLIAFGKTQQDGYKDNGFGKIEIRSGVGQKLIQTIELEEAYISSLGMSSSAESDAFVATVAINSNKIKVNNHDIERLKK